jgi:hypothetical protein
MEVVLNSRPHLHLQTLHHQGVNDEQFTPKSRYRPY